MERVTTHNMTALALGMYSPSSGPIQSPKSTSPEFATDLIRRFLMKQTLDIIFKSDEAVQLRADLGPFDWHPSPKHDGVKV